MASSRVMPSASSATASNITRQSSLYSLKSLTSMNIDDLFRTIESNGTSPAVSRQGSINKVEWAEPSNNDAGGGAAEMTLEDFLERSGTEVAGVAAARGRGRKRMDRSVGSLDPAEKAALQRQKRMIKNRESAARSRERKQAYTAELESLVAQLEEENALLRRQQEEQTQKRLQQLAENLMPIAKQRKTSTLRRTRTVECIHSTSNRDKVVGCCLSRPGLLRSRR